MIATVAAEFDTIPERLKECRNWVCWRYEKLGKGSTHRWCKVPVSPHNGKNANIADSSSWSDFDMAMQIFEDSKSGLAGIGFVFTDDDPFIGVDLDHCLEPETGNLLPWASEIVDLLDSYTEISPSGTGVKIILESSGMLPGRRKSSLGVEIYSSGRYFTITGHVFNEQSLIHKRTDQIQQIHKTHFPPSPTNTDSISKYAMGQQTASDEQILTRAKAAKNGWKFRQLWEGALSHHSGNASEADLSLCRILAFWCGPCPEQIDRLFRGSTLYRPKWDEKHYGDGSTYGQVTVCKAIEAQEKENNFFKWRHGTTGIR